MEKSFERALAWTLAGLAIASGCRSAAVVGRPADAASPADDATVPELASDVRAEDLARDTAHLDDRKDAGVRDMAMGADAADASAPDVPVDANAPDLTDAAVDRAPDVRTWVDPNHGLVGCPDGGSAAVTCDLWMPVSGGVSTLQGNYCGYLTTTSALYYRSNGINPELIIYLSPALMPEVLGGTFAAGVAMESARSPYVKWATPPGACTVQLDSNVCWVYLDTKYYAVSGHGHCTAPAAPQPADAAQPVTIGDFGFTYLIHF